MSTERKYSVDDVRIGNVIRDARNNMQMTQEQLAEAVDVTNAFIGHIERGDRSLSLTTLVGIASELNISMDYLFSDEEMTPDKKVLNDFAQLIDGRTQKTKDAVLDIVRAALQHLD